MMTLDKPAIPAIETYYNSIHFRSRIEARWAVFFDVIGIQYHYEPEKYQTTHGRYIPDFLLPSIGERGTIYEVKGAEPSAEVIEKCFTCSDWRSNGADVAIAWGSIGGHSVISNYACCPPNVSKEWQQCIFCGHIGIACNLHALSCQCFLWDSWAELYDVDPGLVEFSEFATSKDSPMLLAAYEAARSARFESPDLKDTLSNWKRFVATLRDQNVFARPADIHRFHSKSLEFHNDKECPRFRHRRRNRGTTLA